MDDIQRSSLYAAVAGGAAAGALLVIAMQCIARLQGKKFTGEAHAPKLVEINSNSCGSSANDSISSDESNQERDLRKLDMDLLNATVLSEKEASAEECVQWALEEFGEKLVMSTSFGMQSAVLLHMATKVAPNIPVIWIDTGYLHKETYYFAEHLTRRLSLNLKVYQSDVSAARMEALHGQLWDRNDEDSHRAYGVLRKVEPMARALRELGAHAMISGVRGAQTKHRAGLKRITLNSAQKHYRIHPLLHWTQEDVENYLAKHNLPYHPLKRKGYVSIGDKHSTKPLTMSPNTSTKSEASNRNTRFNGKQQECGLHTEKSNVAELNAVLSSLSSISLSRLGQQDGRKNTPHGTNEGIEIYGRANCRFCKAAKRVLDAKKLPYIWYTLQRYDQKKHIFEPPQCDESNSCVTSDIVEHRFESAAPGLPPFETVPQIFQNGEYVGGFTELCSKLDVPKIVMDAAILDIGGDANIKKHNAHSWSGNSANRRVSASALTEDFFNGLPHNTKLTAQKLSHSAPMRTASMPLSQLYTQPKSNPTRNKAEEKIRDPTSQEEKKDNA